MPQLKRRHIFNPRRLFLIGGLANIIKTSLESNPQELTENRCPQRTPNEQILVVDDDQAIRWTLERSFAKLGLRTD